SDKSHDAYFVDRGDGYMFQSSSIMRAWGLGDNYIPLITGSTIGTLNRHNNLSYFAKQVDGAAIYFVLDGKKFPISDSTSMALVQGGDSWPGVQTFAAPAIGLLATDNALNYAFQVGSKWYVFDNGAAHPIDATDVSRWNLTGPTFSSSVFD